MFLDISQLENIKDAKKKKRKDAKLRRNQEKLLGEGSSEKEAENEKKKLSKTENANYSPKDKLKPEIEAKKTGSTKLPKETVEKNSQFELDSGEPSVGVNSDQKSARKKREVGDGDESKSGSTCNK